MIFTQALDYVGQQVDCLVARYVHVAVYKQNEIGRKMTTSLISPLGAECRMLRALKFGPDIPTQSNARVNWEHLSKPPGLYTENSNDRII